MRQLQYGAGGFSYKSIRTSLELFPLLNCGCKFVKLYKKEKKKGTSKHDTLASAKKGSQMGIPSTTQPSQPPRGKEKKVNYEIKDDFMDQEGGRGGSRVVGLSKKRLV